MKKFSNRALFWLGSAPFLMMDQVHAQSTARPVSGELQLEEIVVTGSRVITNGNDSPQPVTVVQTEELLKASPSNLMDALNTVPEFAASRSQTSNTATGAVAGGSGASNQLNLRNLGAIRTLVLMDGQRLPAGTITGVIDADIIPEMLIKRVETVTGGVSAVYGSDAITGVANFVTDRTFNGVKYVAQLGQSTHGDDATYKLGVAAGTELFGGRAHLEGSLMRYHDEGILDRAGARPEIHNVGYYGATLTANCNTATNPCTSIFYNRRNPNATYAGLVNATLTSAQLQTGMTFTDNGGALRAFNNGTVYGTSQSGGDGWFNNASLKAPLTNNQGFVRFDAELTDQTRFHAQAVLDSKSNAQVLGTMNFANYTFRSDNAFLPTNFASTYLSGATTFRLSKAFQNPQPRMDIDVDQAYLNAGLEGKLASFDWGVDVNVGRTHLVNYYNYNINNLKLAAALDAVNGTSGATCYAATQTATAAAYADCVAFNPFGATSFSQAAMDYVTDRTKYLDATNTLKGVSAHISGDVLEAWAGPVKAALSGEWRQISLAYTSEGVTGADATSAAQTISCTGLRAPCGSGIANGAQLYANVLGNLGKKTESVKEVALETNVPVLADLFLAKQLDVNGAIRYTDYDTTGSYTTYKGGVHWQINDSVSLRGTTSKDIRAPTLYDLYQPVTRVFATAALTYAPLSKNLPSGTVYQESAGNPALTAEIGRTKTAGIVLRPGFLPGFSMAFDYYKITVKGAILSNATYSGASSDVQYACYNSGGTSPLCSLIVGNAMTGDIQGFRSTVFNASQLETYGQDIELGYTTRALHGPLDVRLFVAHQPHVWIVSPSGVNSFTTSDSGGATGNPGTPGSAQWRVNGSVSLSPLANLTINVRERWRSSLRPNLTATQYYNVDVDSQAITDLNVGYKLQAFGGDHEVFLNVQNVFDKAPAIYGGGDLGWTYQDDPVGRFVTVGVRGKF